eukprot:6198078-Pleurochrysis_carterae.AAC.3
MKPGTHSTYEAFNRFEISSAHRSSRPSWHVGIPKEWGAGRGYWQVGCYVLAVLPATPNGLRHLNLFGRAGHRHRGHQGFYLPINRSQLRPMATNSK